MNQTIASPQINDRNPYRVIFEAAVARISAGLAAPFRLITSGARALSSQLGFGFAGPLDVDRLSARLAVERRGKSDGEMDLPVSTEEAIVGTQLEIVAYFRELRRAMLNHLKVLNARLRKQCEKVERMESVDRVQIIPHECEKNVQRLIAAHSSKLGLLAERQLQQQRHYETFRAENQLERVAEPRISVVYYCFLVTLTVFGVVTLGNIPVAGVEGTAFISRSWALAAGGLAIVVPFVLATAVFRSVNHVRDLQRVIGWLGGVMGIVSVASTAFVLAHYITAIGSGSELTTRALWASILTTPIAVDANSNVLMSAGVVLIFGLLAFLAGYQSQDPYPGYAAVQRSFYRARDKRERLLVALRMRINKTIDDAEAEIIRTSRQLKANVRKYSGLVEKVKESSASLAPYEIALEETCNIMLCRYRDANIKARQSAVPLSFSEYVCLTNGPDTTGHSVPGMDDDRLGEFSRRIDELRVEMGKARQKMINLQQRVSRDLESVLDEQEPAPEDLARQLT